MPTSISNAIQYQWYELQSLNWLQQIELTGSHKGTHNLYKHKHTQKLKPLTNAC